MIRTSRAVLLGAVLPLIGALPAGALATTITVTTTKDLVAADGLCGLREAITAANLNTETPGAGECPAVRATGSDAVLARAWSRSQAKSLALDLADSAQEESAVDAVRRDLDGATPEKLIARAEELRVARESARESAAVPGHELVRLAELRAAVTRAEAGAWRRSPARPGLPSGSTDCLYGGVAKERRPALPSSKPAGIGSVMSPTPEPRRPS